MTARAFLNPSYEGRLERIQGNRVVGWAWDRSRPEMPVLVEIHVDNVCVCVTLANEHRPDLKRAEKSDGSCAYSALLPEAVCDGKQHVIRAVVSKTDRKVVIGTVTAVLEEVTQFTGAQQPGANGNGKKNVYYPHISQAAAPVIDQRVRAMLGKDDWLFLSHDSNRLHDQLLGQVELNAAQLDVYRRVFAQRVEAFRTLGIPYVFATAPTKELLYEDRLPPGFVIDRTKFPAHQIRTALASDGVDVLCLENALAVAKQSEQVYYRTDTHWNDAGNHAVSAALLQRCQRYLPDLQLESREQLIASASKDGYRGDLANKAKVAFVGGQRRLVHCNEGDFDKQDFTEYPTGYTSSKADTVSDGLVDDYLRVSPTRPTVVKVSHNTHLPRILVFHDSFMTGVIKFLSTSFSRSVFIWRPEVFFDIVKKEKPDIVLHMMADRFIVREPRNMHL